ncbi:TPA: hypothetical protein DCQ44_02730 [Candidatus Taylorbacteria bacterium]|nr:hypothetical protein [Candidatus Taylorbacteria bacterium]
MIVIPTPLGNLVGDDIPIRNAQEALAAYATLYLERSKSGILKPTLYDDGSRAFNFDLPDNWSCSRRFIGCWGKNSASISDQMEVFCGKHSCWTMGCSGQIYDFELGEGKLPYLLNEVLCADVRRFTKWRRGPRDVSLANGYLYTCSHEGDIDFFFGTERIYSPSKQLAYLGQFSGVSVP